MKGNIYLGIERNGEFMDVQDVFGENYHQWLDSRKTLSSTNSPFVNFLEIGDKIQAICKVSGGDHSMTIENFSLVIYYEESNNPGSSAKIEVNDYFSE